MFSAVACPALSKVPHVLVIHGESDGRVDYIKVCLRSNLFARLNM